MTVVRFLNFSCRPVLDYLIEKRLTLVVKRNGAALFYCESDSA
jgi:hypothetical protein